MAPPADGVNFWTNRLSDNFHKQVKSLFEVEKCPGPERVFELPAHEQGEHILSIKDELLLATHVAFLTCWEAGPDAISAATIEERENSLVFTLASNQGPKPEVVKGLKDILTFLSTLARQEIERERLVEDLFDRVVAFSEIRILQRVLPSWLPRRSRVYGTTRTSLQRRIDLELERLSATESSRPLNRPLLKGLRDLAESLEELELLGNGAQPPQPKNLLKNVILKCSSITQLEAGIIPRTTANSMLGTSRSRALLEIDKLAQYLRLCRDLARCCRKTQYMPLFERLEVQACRIAKGPSPSPRCPVHAEVKLILHHERHSNSVTRRPRAIGCSKAACFLCSLFVRHHGKYYLLSTHGRLYDKWTIPDATWMSTHQAERFRHIIKVITETLIQTREAKSGEPKQPAGFFPVESKLNLPQMTASLASVASVARTITQPSVELVEEIPSMPSSPQAKSISAHESLSESVSKISISESRLPYQSALRLSAQPLNIEIGGISLMVESVGGRMAAYLSVVKVQAGFKGKSHSPLVQLEDISTVDGTMIGRSPNSSDLKFVLGLDAENCLEIQVRWDGTEKQSQ